MPKRRRVIKKVVRKGKGGKPAKPGRAKRKPKPDPNVRLMRAHKAHFTNGLRNMCEYVQKHGPPIKKIIEIGSYAGESTLIFADCIPDAEIVCVDPWETAQNVFNQTLKNTGKAAHAKFLERIADYPQISFIKKMSDDAAADFEDDSVDLVYIDGNHAYNFVIRDLRNYMPKLRMGCFMTGHDWYADPKAKWHCVTQACNAILGGVDKVFQDHSWIWLKTEEKLKKANL